jgi:hypothetical protein
MIISHGRSYVFVHIPKTGGTAMATALEGRAMKDDILIGDTPKAKRRKSKLALLEPNGRLWKHSTLVDIDGVLSPKDLKQMFVFTLVRNPWDRMVSYYHWLQEQTFTHRAVNLAQTCDFSGFLNDPQNAASFAKYDYHSYMRDIRGQDQCNLYARLEHLETDLAPLWDHLRFELELPIVNASVRRRDWRDYYTAKDAETLGRTAARDIAQFGYQFDPAP